ncbi:hypothetical protein [Paenibacillus xylaniclasticus]|uniref:hypothetical protein n=1 Tax=Paenibacillus xylaniclasticus TaxID=588083 RepID=UPI000FDA1761|nr:MULTISPECIES: hypothetical protein [Paenibacillus]
MQHFGDRFYCVSCGQLMEMKHAELLFRTGYFRVVHPLGCCLACEQKQSHADMLPDHRRLHSGHSTPHAELMSMNGSTACEAPDLSASWYRPAEEERSPIVPIKFH